jgi:hypothetical protein
MPDAMDQVQALVSDRIADELQRHHDRPRALGRTHCAVADCRAAINAERTALGAQLCIECQHEADARDAHLAAWARRR